MPSSKSLTNTAITRPSRHTQAGGCIASAGLALTRTSTPPPPD
jgi:hypothetical protein